GPDQTHRERVPFDFVDPPPAVAGRPIQIDVDVRGRLARVGRESHAVGMSLAGPVVVLPAAVSSKHLAVRRIVGANGLSRLQVADASPLPDDGWLFRWLVLELRGRDCNG